MTLARQDCVHTPAAAVGTVAVETAGAAVETDGWGERVTAVLTICRFDKAVDWQGSGFGSDLRSHFDKALVRYTPQSEVSREVMEAKADHHSTLVLKTSAQGSWWPPPRLA